MDKMADLLRELAAELGTTVETLWSMIVAKMQYDWLGGIIVASFLAVVGTIGVVKTFKSFSAWDTDYQNKKSTHHKTVVVVDEYRSGKFASATEVFGYNADEALQRRADAKAAVNAKENEIARYVVAWVVFGLMTIVGWITLINYATDISQYLVPEAAALEYIMGIIR